MPEPPLYETPPLNGESPIGELAFEILIEVFRHLPKPEFVTGDFRVENRSAILQVCRQWREVGGFVLRESIDLSGSEEQVASWIFYSEREETACFVVDLCVNELSTSILKSIGGVSNLVLKRFNTGTFEDMRFSDSCPELFSGTQFLEIHSLEGGAVPPQWIFPHLTSLIIRSIGLPDMSLSPFWSWILVPTLTELSVSGWIYQPNFRRSLLSQWPFTLESLTLRLKTKNHENVIASLYRLPLRTIVLPFETRWKRYFESVFAFKLGGLPRLEKIVVVGMKEDLERLDSGKVEDTGFDRQCEERGIVIVTKEVSWVAWNKRVY